METKKAPTRYQVNTSLSAYEFSVLENLAAAQNLPRASIVAAQFIRSGIKAAGRRARRGPLKIAG